MLDPHRFLLFLAAALLLACTPGPGILYVLTRSLAGGRREGILSALGTFCGGLVHVVAAALGLSAVLATSALAFTVVKYAGALYLIWLGIRMIAARNAGPDSGEPLPFPSRHTFRQGIITEVLNPKTALFFLSFIPQFVAAGLGHLFVQFLVLGCISVALNTSADLIVAFFAGPLGRKLKRDLRFRSRQRAFSGSAMIGLGLYVAAIERR